MALVSSTRETHGLAAALRATGLARSTWYYHTRTRVTYAEKYAHLEAPLKAIAEAHPEYGYRRTTAELRETYRQHVNRKVVERLHRLWDLPLRRVSRPKPSAIRRAIDTAGLRANLLSRRKKAEIGPFEVFYTDFTELRFAGGVRKAWLIPLLDHRTKYVAGYAVGQRANSELALTAWNAAQKALTRFRDSLGGVIVHQDQDPVVHRLRLDRPAALGGRAAPSPHRNETQMQARSHPPHGSLEVVPLSSPSWSPGTGSPQHSRQPQPVHVRYPGR